MQYNNYAYKPHFTSSGSESLFNDYFLYFEIISCTNI